MKNIITNILISISALITGYAAMAIPFHLFNRMSAEMMKALFIAEIIIYFTVASIFFLIKEKKQVSREKDKELKKRHAQRVEKRRNEMKGIKVNNYDIAA